MPVSEVCNREVVIVHPDDTIFETAQLMRKHHVGDVLVVEECGGMRVPIGIITDRDLVVEIMAPKLDPAIVAVGDVVTSDLVTVRENVGTFEAIEYMRTKGVRRLPVVDDNGGLIGILTLDDLLEIRAEELVSLAKLVRYEQKKETINRR